MQKYMEEEDDRVIGARLVPTAALWLKLGEGLGISRERWRISGICLPSITCWSILGLSYARNHSWLEGAAMSFERGWRYGQKAEKE